MKKFILGCLFGGMWAFIVITLSELIDGNFFFKIFMITWGSFAIGGYIGSRISE